MDTNEIRFEDPAPPIPTMAEEIQQFADACRQQPGRWALYGQRRGTSGSTRTYAWSLRNAGTVNDPKAPGKRKVNIPSLHSAFAPVKSFEAVCIMLFGEHRIYVRYVGHGSDT
jgi:hypothetical protein